VEYPAAQSPGKTADGTATHTVHCSKNRRIRKAMFDASWLSTGFTRA
jgi:hypothetical protein